LRWRAGTNCTIVCL